MKIALLGYGKMGKIIEKIAISRKHEIVLKIDYDNLHDLLPKTCKRPTWLLILPPASVLG
jgi:4-hydroxy-tetrahydrodipicolinate reductase